MSWLMKMRYIKVITYLILYIFYRECPVIDEL